MNGRKMHSVSGKLSDQPYGHHIFSVGRLDMNCRLLDELEKLPNVKIFFRHKCRHVTEDGEVTFENKSGKSVKVQAEFVLGADGAYSGVRQALLRMGRFNLNQNYVAHGYKELTIYPDEETVAFFSCFFNFVAG
jgi:kynurenine 3-monooxygenase